MNFPFSSCMKGQRWEIRKNKIGACAITNVMFCEKFLISRLSKYISTEMLEMMNSSQKPKILEMLQRVTVENDLCSTKAHEILEHLKCLLSCLASGSTHLKKNIRKISKIKCLLK